MKFMNLKVEKLDDFFNVINSCDGNVFLEGPDMKLNLKSKLCQYVSLAKLCSAGIDEIKELNIIADNPDDTAKLMKFMFNGIA